MSLPVLSTTSSLGLSSAALVLGSYIVHSRKSAIGGAYNSSTHSKASLNSTGAYQSTFQDASGNSFADSLQDFLNQPLVKKISQILKEQLAFLNEFVSWLDHSGLSEKLFKKQIYTGWFRNFIVDPAALTGIILGASAESSKGPFYVFMKGLFLAVFSFLVTNPVIGFCTKLMTRFGNNMLTRSVGGALGIALLEIAVKIGEKITPWLERSLGFDRYRPAEQAT